MNLILDLVILCVFVLFIVVGIRRGLVKSAAHFLGSILAAFFASALGGAIANFAFNALFRDALVERIGESLSSLGTGSMFSAIEKVLSSLPDFINRALQQAGINSNTLESVVADRSNQAAELIADALSPVFVSFLKVLAVIVLFALFMVIVRVLADMAAGVFRLPMLRQVNGALGGLFGFLLALVSVWIAVSAVQVFTPMLAAETQADVEIMLDRSFLAGLIIRINPLGAMFR
ncbi:MAG: CvpA family protein [Acutalibacter sp.]|nr:CvpA family protein [Acutalibacter sp.]